MTISIEITITNPDGTVSQIVDPTNVSIRHSMSAASTMVCVFESDYDDFQDEDDPTNPNQLNSKIVFKRTGRDLNNNAVVRNAFFGYVQDRKITQGMGGERIITIPCVDPIGKLNESRASIEGEPLFVRETPAIVLAEVPLYPVPPIGDNIYPFYPQLFDHEIVAVDTGSEIFSISGDHTATLLDNDKIEVSESTDNDGVYTLDGDSTFAGGNTLITVTEDITDATVDGQITPAAWLPRVATTSTTLGVDIGVGKYQVLLADVGNDVFTILGDLTAEFIEDVKFEIVEGGNNNGNWTVDSSATAGPNTDITVKENITSTDAGFILNRTLILDATKRDGMPPAGVWMMDDEIGTWDGLIYNDTNSVYFAYNIERSGYNDHPYDVVLNSTAATHTAGAGKVHHRLAKGIHPSVGIVMEAELRDTPGTFEFINENIYVSQNNEGRFDFTYSIINFPTGAGNTTYDQMRVSIYGCFDETSDEAVTVESIIIDILTELFVDGGPGWTNGVHFALTLDDLRIQRLNVNKTKNIRELIDQIFNELGFKKGADTDSYGFWYDHTDTKFRVNRIQQKASGSEDFILDEALSIDTSPSLAQIKSAYTVEYTRGVNFNLAGVDRMWHPEFNVDAVGDNAVVPEFIIRQDEEQDLIDGWGPPFFTPAGNNNFTDRLFDGQEDTGWGILFGTNPGPNSDVLFGHFGSLDGINADDFVIDDVEVVFDCRRTSTTPDPFDVEVFGITNYDIADPPNSTGVVRLSGALRLAFEEGSLDAKGAVKIQAAGLGKILQGYVIRYAGLQKAKGIGNQRATRIKEIVIRGKALSTVDVKLVNVKPSTGEPGYTSNTLLAKESYDKLINADGNLGMHKWGKLRLNNSSRNTAITLGLDALLQSLILSKTRTYQIVNPIEEIPQLGDTVLFPDGFSGVVLSVDIDYVRGAETIVIRAIDFITDLELI